MAFETRTLVNGEWITTRADVDSVLRYYDQQDREATSNVVEIEKAPSLGLLTQTVIRSPLAHWILPVRIQNTYTQHVAFIGDDFVQIKELLSNGQLWDVIRKENFGARIRNARIVGSIKAFDEDPDATIDATQIKDEDHDISMGWDDAPRKPRAVLPPQFILLQLHTGDSVFLMLRQSEGGKLEFVSSRYRVSKPMLNCQPGMHLAVDPSSRYMAIGCSEEVFAIYALHPRHELKQQYSRGPNLRLVESETYVYVKGVILMMEFLHPSPDDEGHIILLVLRIVKGKTRMMIYEWETGTDLNTIRPHNPNGHALQKSYQLPLLLIPLTIKSSFIIVCEDTMSVCHGILQGTPNFIVFNNRVDPPTSLHHGPRNPLWMSWTRPTRVPNYRATRDDLFLAREDGLIKFLEIDSEVDEFVKTITNIGEFEGNCGTALASLDHQGVKSDGDLLVTGGDSCAGGTYLIEARKTPKFRQPIPNWSPAMDLVTTYASANRDLQKTEEPKLDEDFPKPDRVFACVGKGIKGSIAEFRSGFEASIGFEMEYYTPIMQVWVFPLKSGSSDDSIYLLSMGDRSAVLRLSLHTADVAELHDEETRFDLNHRTITASTQGEYIIQVTEQSIVIIRDAQVQIHHVTELCGVQGNPRTAIDDATIGEGLILFTSRQNDDINLHVLEPSIPASSEMNIDDDSMPAQTSLVRKLAHLLYQPTCLAVARVKGVPMAIVTRRNGRLNSLEFLPLTTHSSQGVHKTIEIPSSIDYKGAELEEIVSLAIAPTSLGSFLLLCGTRNGILFTLEIDESVLEIISSRTDRIGATPVIVHADELSSPGKVFFLNCDSKSYALMPKLSRGLGSTQIRWVHSHRIEQIWVTDALTPALQQPKITFISSIHSNLADGPASKLLLVAGPQLFVTSFSTQTAAFPRHIPVKGTPSRLLYSHTLDILIVAASVNGKSTLLFIDPETGEDLAQPMDQKTKSPVDFVSGLGNANERVFNLFEWSYTKDGKTWNFIIVSTNTGRLLILSVANQDRVYEDIQRASRFADRTSARVRSRIGYYTRYKFKCADPVYSVTGFTDGLLWCAGTYLFCDTLDLSEKKFKRVAEYELPSPAIDLAYENGTIYALSNNHSLEVLQLVSNEIGELYLMRTHSDQLSRATLHRTMLHLLPSHPIHLISDKLCSLVGLYPTRNTKVDTLEPVFEAELPYSVLRFRSARCRPIWDPTWNRSYSNKDSDSQNAIKRLAQLESMPHLMAHSETLGLSITGSLSHHSLLDMTTWRFLRFIIELAIRSPKVCEFTYVDDPMRLELATEPKLMMHIDGDVLKRCLEDQRLEELLCLSQKTAEASRTFKKFYELLQELHLGLLEEGAEPTVYVEQAYVDLEFFLRPVI